MRCLPINLSKRVHPTSITKYNKLSLELRDRRNSDRQTLLHHHHVILARLIAYLQGREGQPPHGQTTCGYITLKRNESGEPKRNHTSGPVRYQCHLRPMSEVFSRHYGYFLSVILAEAEPSYAVVPADTWIRVPPVPVSLTMVLGRKRCIIRRNGGST